MADGRQYEYDGAAGDRDAEESQRAEVSDLDVDLPFAEGAVFGAGAFLVNYLVAYATTASAMAAKGAAPIDAPGTWKVAAWSLLSTLGVGLERAGERTTPAEVAVLVETRLEGGMAVVEPSAVAYLLPLVVLGAAGYGIATYCGADDVEEAVTAAVAIVPAVLACSVTFAVLSAHSFDVAGDVTTARLITGEAILYAGILYPATFGILGGRLAVWSAPVDLVLELYER